MIGNDLVDLCDAETREAALHSRFDARVFNATERAELARAADRHRLRWTFWAAKEAAFKWLRRHEGRAIFAPRRFAVVLDSIERGSVQAASFRLPFQAQQASEFVHVVVKDPNCPAEQIASRVEPIGHAASPSVFVRQLAKTFVSQRLGLDASQLDFLHASKIPRLVCASGPVEVALSLSHHGRFAAFASAGLRGCGALRGWA